MRITTITNTILDDNVIHTTVVKVDSRYEHDCDDCLFFGCHEEFDLYFCPTHGDLIARFGIDGDYRSVRTMHLGHWLFSSNDPLEVLKDKLQAMNLV